MGYMIYLCDYCRVGVELGPHPEAAPNPTLVSPDLQFQARIPFRLSHALTFIPRHYIHSVLGGGDWNPYVETHIWLETDWKRNHCKPLSGPNISINLTLHLPVTLKLALKRSTTHHNPNSSSISILFSNNANFPFRSVSTKIRV